MALMVNASGARLPAPITDAHVLNDVFGRFLCHPCLLALGAGILVTLVGAADRSFGRFAAASPFLCLAGLIAPDMIRSTGRSRATLPFALWPR